MSFWERMLNKHMENAALLRSGVFAEAQKTRGKLAGFIRKKKRKERAKLPLMLARIGVREPLERGRREMELLAAERKGLLADYFKKSTAAKEGSKLILRRLYNPLTGLHSKEFYKEVESELSKPEHANSEIAIASCDLKGFKNVNDQHGHEAGDKMLKRVAELLEEARRKEGLEHVRIFHPSGDEFIVMAVRTMPEETGAELAVRNLLEQFQLIKERENERDKKRGAEALHVDETELIGGVSSNVWKKNASVRGITASADTMSYVAKLLGHWGYVSEKQFNSLPTATQKKILQTLPKVFRREGDRVPREGKAKKGYTPPTARKRVYSAKQGPNVRTAIKGAFPRLRFIEDLQQ
ncbi:GGDEF domain-containing protein [Candidatus Micrarchaeota archaeon]|nr:GGDEF domain-containing protein [Candidatus Micrarchaeota archaeon]